jgi:hypothetical protein
MNRHPLVATLVVLWHIVRAVLLGVQYLVAGVLTFCLKTVPRLWRNGKASQEEDYALADRLRRREN